MCIGNPLSIGWKSIALKLVTKRYLTYLEKFTTTGWPNKTPKLTHWGKTQLFIQKILGISFEKCECCEKWDFENVNFVNNESLKLWISWKIRFWKCEFCEKWCFQNVNFWINCGFLLLCVMTLTQWEKSLASPPTFSFQSGFGSQFLNRTRSGSHKPIF